MGELCRPQWPEVHIGAPQLRIAEVELELPLSLREPEPLREVLREVIYRNAVEQRLRRQRDAHAPRVERPPASAVR